MSVRLIAKWPRWLLAMVMLCVLAAGCSRSARSLSLNQPKAREACTAFLTAWKDGKKVGDLAPKIVGRDSDWETGKKLEAFEVLPKDHSDGTNLHLKVRRILKDEKGRTINQEVDYVVGTSPVVTVFRSDE
ncbi:MAG: hypothetical protein AABP62_06745 [Planctomycetota bacterium]